MSAPASESSEARQKFANAKAISSDMFFGRESSAEVRPESPVQISGSCCWRGYWCYWFMLLLTGLFLSQYEAKTRLENMSSSTSISSADLFGDGSDPKGKTRTSHVTSV